MPPPPVDVNAEYLRAVDGARREIKSLILEKKCAATLVRLAWHDAATFDKATRLGGPNGSIRIPREAGHAANVGLSWAVECLEFVKSMYPAITYADLYQLAGVTAIEMCGGPTLAWLPGRRDSRACPPEGRLPGPEQAPEAVKAAFERMGITSPRHIVMLLTTFSWANSAGRGCADSTPMEGTWEASPLKLDMGYLRALLGGHGKKLPTDKLLMEDPALRAVAEEYAQDEGKFWDEYGGAHRELSELGQKLQPPGAAASGRATAGVAASAGSAGGGGGGEDTMLSYGTGVAIAVGAALAAVWFDRRRRRLLG